MHLQTVHSTTRASEQTKNSLGNAEGIRFVRYSRGYSRELFLAFATGCEYTLPSHPLGPYRI